MSGRAFVFLDRDGTLLHDPGYLHRIEDYALLPGVTAGLAELQSGGFRLAIVTNQSGLGRGYYGPAEFEAIQAKLVSDLDARGVRIEATYFCPHLPDAGCDCRKPAPGMLQRAERELGAELARSWVIGDALTDAQLAVDAGCRAVCVRTGKALAPGELPDGVPLVDDLPAAAREILRAR